METYAPPFLKKDYSKFKKLCSKISDKSILSSSAKDNPFSEFPCKYCTKQETEHKFRDEGMCDEFKCTEHGGSVIEMVIIDRKGTSQQSLFNAYLE